MKVALAKGETLQIAVVDGDRIIGTMSIALDSAVASVAAPAAAPAKAAKSVEAAPAKSRRGGKRKITAEARKKMAQSQALRWERYRAQKAQKAEKAQQKTKQK